MWFLGGEDGREALGMRNDLWSFSVAAQEWTWHAGTAGYNGTARYSHWRRGLRAGTPEQAGRLQEACSCSEPTGTMRMAAVAVRPDPPLCTPCSPQPADLSDVWAFGACSGV